MKLPETRVRYPSWVASDIDWEQRYPTVEGRMRLAIQLSRENVLRDTGGPFGAAIFEHETGRLVSVGVNLVVANANSTLHAEMVAFMMAEARLGHYSLGSVELPAHDLVTSCDPCAMCLGAILWAGVKRVVTGAGHMDAKRLGFDEGPVFPESYEYLESKGIEVVRGVLRQQAAEVLDFYRERGGPIYNG